MSKAPRSDSILIIEYYLQLNDIVAKHGKEALSSKGNDLYVKLSKHPIVQAILS